MYYLPISILEECEFEIKEIKKTRFLTELLFFSSSIHDNGNDNNNGDDDFGGGDDSDSEFDSE